MREKIAVAVLAFLAAAPAAQAEKITIKEDTWINIGLLLQPQFTLTQRGAPDGGVSPDFFLRRGRLILAGQFDSRIGFVFITDQANFGKDGDFSTQFIIQDALGTFKVAPELTIDAGFMFVPFIRHFWMSAGALNAIDYHGPVNKYPPTGRAFRDMGIELRGLVVDGMFYYRAGVFNGIEGRAATTTPPAPAVNTGDAPRLAGTFRWNILGKEDAYAVPGIYFAKDPIASIGVAIDFQPSAFADGSSGRYLALGADAFLEYPFDDIQEIVAQAAIIRYNHYLAGTTIDDATAFFLEAGYRYDFIEPKVSLEYFDGDVAGSRLVTLRLGANWWIQKNTYNLKAEIAFPFREEVTGTTVQNNFVITVQGQTLF